MIPKETVMARQAGHAKNLIRHLGTPPVSRSVQQEVAQ
jgi:hypothetical protein